MNFLQKTIIQLGSRLGVLVSGLLLTKWLISNLTPQDYFNYSQITDLLISMVLIIISFSIPSLALRRYSNQEFRANAEEVAKFWSTMVCVRVISYFVGLILIIIGAHWIGQGDKLSLAILLYSAQFLLIADSIYKSITDATARSYIYGITDFVGKMMIVALLFGINWFFPDSVPQDYKLYFFSSILFIGYLLSLGLDIILNKSYTKFSYPDFGIIRTELKSIFYFTAIGALSFFYISSFTYFLKLYNVDVISYNSYVTAFFKIFSTTATFGLILTPSVAVHFTEAYKNKNKPSMNKALIKFFGIFAGIYLLMGMAIPIIVFLIDPTNKYPQTTQYAFWLLPLIGVFVTNSFINNITTLLHREKLDFWITAILFAINLFVQVILVSRFGVDGTIASFYIVLILDLILKSLLLGYSLKEVNKT